MRERLEYQCSNCGRVMSIVVHQPTGARWVPMLECTSGGCEGLLTQHTIVRVLTEGEAVGPHETLFGQPAHTYRDPDHIRLDPATSAHVRPHPGPPPSEHELWRAQYENLQPGEAVRIPPPNQVDPPRQEEVGTVGGGAPEPRRVDRQWHEVHGMVAVADTDTGRIHPTTAEAEAAAEAIQAALDQDIQRRMDPGLMLGRGVAEDLTVQTLRDAAERYVEGVGQTEGIEPEGETDG